ncbi:MAG: peptidase S10 [Candidatus Eremiobacteraeota bacterium]|nr:peptidase S10 [Candidatus Eremiobacteraeota bacterium]
MRMRRFAAVATAALTACLALASARASAADPPVAVTHHSVTVGGKPIAYTARAGTFPLRNADGEEIARVFAVSYTADGTNPATRPVTFFRNGGPGTATMWLHIGSYGPVRVAVPSNAALPAPGTPLMPNPDTLLDLTDIVFIDAVGTGYSQITGKGTPKTFYGIDEDARAFDDIIRTWTTDNNRWSSPKFLFGESYGTMRAATTVARLQADGMAVNGVILLSSALDYNALDIGQGLGEDYSNVAFLPSLAAVAWYHHALPAQPANLEPFLNEVQAFATGPYADALMRGDTLDAATRRAVVAKLHAYTGLDEAYIDRANLRIDPSRFEHQLEAARGIVVGRVDARYQGPELDRTGDSATYDPSFSDAMTDAYVGAFTRYVRDDLGFKVDRPYIGGSGAVNRQWNYRRTNSIVAPNGAGDLRAAMTKNPYLRVFSANGYFDLATPFFGTEYTLSHLGLDPSLRSHVEYGFYKSGHMVYHNDDARRALKADLTRFYRAAGR